MGVFFGFSRYEKAKLKIEEESAGLSRKVNYRKLRFEVALEAVDMFAKFENDFVQIRSPFVMEGELKELASMPEENEFIKNAKKHTNGGVAILRLDKRADTLAAINRLEPRFRMIFNVDEPFKKIRSARHKVWVAAHMLVEGVLDKEHTSAIWNVSDSGSDEVSNLIREAVTEIEAICRPVVREDD